VLDLKNAVAMPAFTDWYDIIGTGVQSLFAWTTFNRDAFADNVGWRQNQRYQQKNYHISWIAVARDDIRDMMAISVNRLNNFMIVNGLILGVAGSAITSASFNTKASPFLVSAFLVCIATAIVFLVLAIMFGIKGQNCAFTNTMKLLTWEMRPENPADYNHDYMSQAQWIEKNGLTQMFRIPGLMPNYKTDAKVLEHELPEHMKKLKAEAAAKGQYAGKHAGSMRARGSDSELVAEDFTALEHLEVSSTSLWYLTKFGHFMRLWMPYDTHCKYAMGMGMLSLGHAGAYFTMATILSGGWDVPWYAAVGACFAFVYMVALVIQQNFKEVGPALKFTITAVLCLGPTLGVYAATTKVDLLHKYLWIMCFFFHFAFWSFAYFGTYSPKVLRASRLGAVGTEGGFWGQTEAGHYTKHTGKHFGHQQSGEGKGNMPAAADATVVGNGSQQTPSEKSDWSDTEYDTETDDEDDASYPGSRSAAYRYKEDGGGGGTSSAAAAESFSGTSSSSASAAAAAAFAVGQPHDHSLSGSHDKVISGAGRWPTDDHRFEDKVEDTKHKVRNALQQTIIVVICVWFSLLVWVITQAFYVDEDSPLRRTYAGESAQVVKWPSPFLRPTRIACVEASSGSMGYDFLADDFRIFKLTASVVTEAPCHLNSTIRDLSSYCDGACWPVVLAEGNHIVDCQTGVAERLLQDAREAFLLSVYTTNPGKPLREQKLIISPGDGKLVQYMWSRPKDGWVPEYELTPPGGVTDDPVAIDVSGDQLVLFYGVKADQLAIRRRDLKNMEPSGTPWSLSSVAAPLRHGCSFDRGTKAMVLPKLTSQHSSPSVIRLDFAKTHSAFTNS